MSNSKSIVMSHPEMIAEFVRQSEFEGLFEKRFAVLPDFAALLFRNGELVDTFKGGHFSVNGVANALKKFVGGSQHIAMLVADLKPFYIETALMALSSDNVEIVGSVRIDMQVNPDKPENILGMMHGASRSPGERVEPTKKDGPVVSPPPGRLGLSKREVAERIRPHLEERVFSQAIGRVSAEEIRGNVALQDKIQADVMKTVEDYCGKIGLLANGVSVEFARNPVEQENIQRAEMARQMDSAEFRVEQAKRQMQMQHDATLFEVDLAMQGARLQQATEDEIKQMALDGEIRFIDAREAAVRRQELEALEHEVRVLSQERMAKFQDEISQMGHAIEATQLQMKLDKIRNDIEWVNTQAEVERTKLVALAGLDLEDEAAKRARKRQEEEDRRQRENMKHMFEIDQDGEDRQLGRDIKGGDAAARWKMQEQQGEANAYATKAAAVRNLDRDQIMALGATLSPDVAAVLMAEAQSNAANQQDAMARMQEMVVAAQAQNVDSREQALEMLRISMDGAARVAHGAGGKGDPGPSAGATPQGGSMAKPGGTTVDCPKCGRTMPADYRVCPGCGHKMRTCQKTAASDPDGTFCGYCGAELMRCMAFETCFGVLDERGLCTSCVSPRLYLDQGAVQEVTAGGTLSLPLRLGNATRQGRAFFVKGVWTREGGNWEPTTLVWDRVDGGEVQPFTVRATNLDKPGAHQIEIAIAIASRWQWREEVFAFAATLSLTATGQSSITVNQSIVNNAAENGFGSSNYAPIKISTGETARVAGSTAQAELALVRATRMETEFGLRGMKDGQHVLRNAVLTFVRFGASESPEPAPIATRDGLLAFGRDRTKQTGGLTDVRLVVRKPDGSIDNDASLQVSRRHFDLFICNDRLMARAESEAGLVINGKAYRRGKLVELQDGDMLAPLGHFASRLSLKLRFESHADGVAAIRLTRQPASDQGGS